MCRMDLNPNLFAKLEPLCKRIEKCGKTQLKWCMANTRRPCIQIEEELLKEIGKNKKDD